MTQDDLAADQDARLRAVDPARSVILQAPAGSGKTTVLIERLLVLLAQAETPEEILAITFTRKAAAEMALRIAQVLQGDSAPARAVLARSRERGWKLEENPGRLRIQTLDALNRALALQMPLAARGSGALGVLPQPRAAYLTAARRTLLDAQTDATLRPDVQLLFERMENDFARCESLIAGMLEKRTHWLPYLLGDGATQLAQRVRESLEAVVSARLARARQLVPVHLVAQGLEICAAAARNLGREFPAAPGAGVALGHWQALAAQALTKAGEWRRRFDVRAGFPAEDVGLKARALQWLGELTAQRGVLELFAELRLLPDPRLSADESEVLGVLARLLGLAVAELEVVFTELGRVDYPAIAAAARAALGSVDEPTDLALRMDSRLRHILVDEFQDTSLEQTRLLTLLTAGWESGDGRTLFLVGDPMQSIYGFREAEVGMFLGARTAGVGTVALEALTLRRNFRSAREIVDWNNRVFADCFPEVDDPRTSSVAYAHSLAARTGARAGAVQLHRTAPGDTAGEARAIATLVTDLRAREPDASIAILVSARTHAAAIVAALEAVPLAVVGVELVSLAQLSIIRDLTALTQALDHLADRPAWLALLRAPWCGLTLAQISVVAGADRRAILWERMTDPAVQALLPAEAAARLQRLQRTLAVCLEEGLQTYASGRERLARRVESAWLRLGGPAACAAPADLTHARAFFEALAQWSQEPDWNGPRDLPLRLGRLFAAHSAPAAQAVQIMTIHRAKGLEFDHVILPGLGRQRRARERELLQWLDLPRGTSGSDLLMVAMPPAAAAGPTALGRYVTRLQDQRERHEATRLLYVAATRARQQLHLFGDPEQTPRAGTLLARLWPALKDQFPDAVTDPTALPHSDERAPAVASLERLSAGWALPQLAAGPRPEGLAIASYEATPLIESADLIERAVCEILRSQARRRRLPPNEDAALTQLLAGQLQRLGAAPETATWDLAPGVALLRACLEDSRLRWMFENLSRSGAHGEAPLALTGVSAGRLTSTRADLSFKDPAGTRWLIDIAPCPQAAADLTQDDAALERAFGSRLARHLHLAQGLEPAGAARAAIYVPARQLFWTYGP